MFFAGVRAACAREVAYLRAHPWDLALISWVPLLAMALAWAIFAQGVNIKLPLAFVDEDHSADSRHLAVALEAARSTNIAARPTTLEEAWPLVRSQRAYAVVHVPTDWERRSQRGDPLPVVLYTNEQFHVPERIVQRPDDCGASSRLQPQCSSSTSGYGRYFPENVLR